MRAVLAEQHVGEQLWPGASARDRMRRRRWLRDRLALPARHLLAHDLANLPARRHALQHLGYVLAELAQLTAAARACRRRWLDAALARQVVRQRTTRGLASRGRRCRALLTLRRL